MDFEIRSNNKFSWSYIYELDGKSHEIWADSVDTLRRKVLARKLPWDDCMVPQAKPVRTALAEIRYIDCEGSPASFRLPWCKSNYKRY